MKFLALLFALLIAGCGSKTNPNWEVETDAKPSISHPYGGFWKTDPKDTFGLAIGPYDESRYYVSFCGPGGCFAKGSYRPITTLKDDSAYRIIDANTIEVKGHNGVTTYYRSDGRIGSKLIK